MPKILVIGATGYLGNALSTALVRASHTVYGLARSESKGKSLAAQEIIPVTGSVQDSNNYLNLIRDKRIDVVVDASGAMDGASQLLKDLVNAGKERLEQSKRDGVVAQRLGFVYTSGMWVHGSSVDQVADLDPVGVPAAKTSAATLVAWRPQLERDILASKDVLDVAVLRPALMYGLRSSLWAIALGPILLAAQQKQGSVDILADPNCMAALAHVEDVALAYVQAIERVHILAGTGVVPVFDLQTSWENVRVVLETFARYIGYKGTFNFQDPVKTENVFAQAMSASVKGDSTRARQLLDWRPTRIDGFVAGMEVYGGAFIAGL